MTNIINRLVLWYLKRNHLCLIEHGKYGWKIKLNFHSQGNYKLELFTLELAKEAFNTKELEDD